MDLKKARHLKRLERMAKDRPDLMLAEDWRDLADLRDQKMLRPVEDKMRHGPEVKRRAA